MKYSYFVSFPLTSRKELSAVVFFLRKSTAIYTIDSHLKVLCLQFNCERSDVQPYTVIPKLKKKQEKRLQRSLLSAVGHTTRGIGTGSRSSPLLSGSSFLSMHKVSELRPPSMTAVIGEQTVSETARLATDDSGSEYFPTPKKGRQVLQSPESSKEEREVPPNCLFFY